jgi:Holliday junction resolvasome RuvABC endonuclease subunit
MKIKIIGIDPAIRNFGMAIAMLDLQTLTYEIENLILLETGKETGKVVRQNSDDLRRARVLAKGMVAACQGVTLAFAEVPVGSQSARAMASYGMCVGVLAACPVPLIEVTPSEVKLAAVGHKQAAKEEMIEWAVAKFPKAQWLYRKLKGSMVPMNDNEHLADAVASIEAGIRTQQFEQVRSMWLRVMPEKVAA